MSVGRHTWEPGPRPIGGRLFDAVGRALRRRGWRRRLSAAAIWEEGSRVAGFAGDGEPHEREALAVLVESLEREAALSPLGRLLMRWCLEHFAVNRLRLARLVSQVPEIAERSLGQPLIVVGLPRTGTTLLYTLLCRDPAARPLLGWESLWPVPRGSRLDATGDRRRRARIVVRALERFAPAVRTIHPLRAEAPEEDTWLLAHTFVSMTFSLLARVESYSDWLRDSAQDALRRAYDLYRLELQALDWQRPGGFWVLKSPAHLPTLAALLERLPEARIVMMHRDPLAVVPSTCSLFATVRGVFSDEVEPQQMGPALADRLAGYQHQAEEASRRFPERVLDVRFEELVERPLETLRGVYRHAGRAFRPELGRSAEAWLARHRRPPEHRYDLDQFGLDRDRVLAAFGR